MDEVITAKDIQDNQEDSRLKVYCETGVEYLNQFARRTIQKWFFDDLEYKQNGPYNSKEEAIEALSKYVAEGE